MPHYDRWLVPLDLKIQSTANLRHRPMLQVLRDHTAGEYERDLDQVLSTLVEEAQFNWYVQIVYSAAQLTAAGIPAPAGRTYLQRAQVGTVFPFRHGPDGPGIIGEDCYLPKPVMQPRSLDELRLLAPDEMALHQ